MTIEAIIAMAASGFFLLLGYLLKRRDDQIEKDNLATRAYIQKELEDVQGSIRLLFQKHDQDAARLEELRYQIAGGHYTKAELNQILDRLEKNLTDLFNTTNAGVREVMVQVQAIAAKVDTLSTTVTQHVAMEDRTK